MDERKDWELNAESELRLEVSEQEVRIRLDRGNAEIFGAELAKGKEYRLLNRSKLAIFTWRGCQVTVFGNPDVAYVSEETPNVMYLNVHLALDQRRFHAEREDHRGPRVDVGKSTLCRILLNYAVRMGRKPLFIDLDIGQGSISIPGAIGLSEVGHLSDPVEGFNELVPMVFHYGHISPDSNQKLYRSLTSQVALMFEKKCEISKPNKFSGCIINTCGWVEGVGYKVLEYACLAFDVSQVLVLDNERLVVDMKKNLPPEVNVVPLPKSGGVVVRNRFFRKESRREAVREYFYGKRGGLQLFPFSFDVPFSEIEIYKIGGPPDQEHLLPTGMKKKDRSLELSAVEPSKELSHHILSVSMAESVEEDIVRTCVAGFILVTSVDVEKQILTVLAPAQKPLPRKILIYSDITFMDIQ